LITPPHAVALAAGELREVGGSPVLTLSLSCDVRIVSGELAAGLLREVRTRLEEADL
jgi:pyruvate/2-oxoglutarate dehydrogenase complex dihydrolipoamide acyltransferase (E2) component